MYIIIDSSTRHIRFVVALECSIVCATRLIEDECITNLHIYIYVQTYIHTYINIYWSTHTHFMVARECSILCATWLIQDECMFIHKQIYMYIHTHIHLNKCLSTHPHNVCVTQTHVHTFAHSYTHTHTHMHAPTQCVRDTNTFYCSAWMQDSVCDMTRLDHSPMTYSKSVMWLLKGNKVCPSAPWLVVHACDTTHPAVWRDSFWCVTWLVHLGHVTH